MRKGLRLSCWLRVGGSRNWRLSRGRVRRVDDAGCFRQREGRLLWELLFMGIARYANNRSLNSGFVRWLATDCGGGTGCPASSYASRLAIIALIAACLATMVVLPQVEIARSGTCTPKAPSICSSMVRNCIRLTSILRFFTVSTALQTHPGARAPVGDRRAGCHPAPHPGLM